MQPSSRFDVVFDSGLITFDNDGKIIISSSLTLEVKQFLQFDRYKQLWFILPYLCFQRENVAKH
jgi:hypothetical protein